MISWRDGMMLTGEVLMFMNNRSVALYLNQQKSCSSSDTVSGH